jgi:hypothetical protein
VTSDRDWELDRDRLQASLDRWHSLCRRTRHRDFVDEFLMDLVKDPFECGHEDGESEMWIGEAGGVLTRIAVVYYPERETRRVFVTDINYL